MIHFYSETDFDLNTPDFYQDWLSMCVDKEGGVIEEINLIFCSDDYLLKINQDHLNHDYYTDIITFDYSEDKNLAADIFISVDRVSDNAFEYEADFEHELCRVMVHGFLHLLGYNDKTDAQQSEMTKKENECLSLLFHN